MPFRSPFPDVEIPKTNVFSYLFPEYTAASTAPLWIDAKHTSENITTEELLQWVKRLGVGFDRLGIKKGDVILVHSPNHVFLPVIYLAIIATGRIFSGANPVYTAAALIERAELAYQLQDTGAQLLLAYPTLLDTACDAATRAALSRHRILLFSEKETAPVNGIPDWHTILGSNAEAERYQWISMEKDEATRTIAVINYSSGTTGLPKGVCISHYNLIANVAQIVAINKADQSLDMFSERWIGFLPLYHAYGQMYTCLVAPKLGIPVYLMKKFDFGDMLWTVETHKITKLHIAPPVMVLLGKRPETSKYNLKSLRDITCGAAPLSGELQHEVSRKLKIPIQQGWGMTEATCGGVSTLATGHTPIGSVGVLHPNLQGRLVADDGQEVPEGQPGELWLSGPTVSLGYWKNDKATRDTITHDGWLKTGDVAVLRDDRLYMVDRKKELIKVKGFQVAPAELEAVLLEHDDIADAAVVGMQISHHERPRAYVMLKPQAMHRTKEEDIHAWIRTRVSPHKYLTGGIAFVDEVPKSASGKILRKVMREWAKHDAAGLDPGRGSKL
ncbi:MAG: hypothetical protein Q9224_004850 [Gallowayella concinna]